MYHFGNKWGMADRAVQYNQAEWHCQGKQGVKAGLFRPITLWPFPEDQLEQACAKAKKVLTVEMSMGQMIQDVRMYSGKKKSEIDFYGEPGGVIPKLDVIVEKVKSYN